MTRLRRILLNVATVLSLLLCVVCAVLWARCRLAHETDSDAVMLWKVDVTEERAHQRALRIWSRDGAVHLDSDSNVVEGPEKDRPGTAWRSTPWRAARVGSASIVAGERGGDVVGFRLWYSRSRGVPPAPSLRQEFRGVSVPYWAIVPVLAVLPSARLWGRRRREGWRVAGWCTECGYDLRATPGRCPECGAVGDGGGEVGSRAVGAG